MRRAAVSIAARQHGSMHNRIMMHGLNRSSSSQSRSPPSFEQSTTMTDIFAANNDDQGIIADVPLTQMTGYSTGGFQINGILCAGPVLLLPRTFTLWRNVASLESVSLESLILATIYAPRISVLFIGTGHAFRPPTPALQQLAQHLKQRHNITVEFMRSISAGSTFNFLNQEGRDVAAALLPSKPH
jgi:uncharacterized protein